MADPAAPHRSALDDFIDTPMGPGLTGEEAIGQTVHPQAPQPTAPTQATSTGGAGARAAAPPVDPTKQAPGERLGSEIAAARIDLGDGVLRTTETGGTGSAAGSAPLAGDVGGGNAGGFGATLGMRDPTPGSIAPAADADRDSANEQQDARRAQAAAQSGHPERAAPDQTRAEGRAGSINDTDGL